ncbi:MAG: 16S rRNA (cytosine(1402)-N(4))-methyltransferase RsmH [Bacteroidota bacterium]|nr:16S rRNA (cytosine(1402)-N(4))-methyltransferase RsmH [Bacteroidota bacterium]
MNNQYHTPVLLKESVSALSIQTGGNYVDATYGGGGHSKEILDSLEKGKLLAFDQDADAIANRRENEQLILVKANFSHLKRFLSYYDMLPIDGLLADLGISSHQIDMAPRGFSFREEADLDMRMNQNAKKSAWEVVNTYSIEDLAEVFKKYGEIKNAYPLAKRIILERSISTLKTTKQLKQIVENFAPHKNRTNKYLSQVFQAIRIEVNQEIAALEILLKQLPEVLKVGGKIAFISYHSLEDRLVKNFINTGNLDGEIVKDAFGLQHRPFTPNPKKMIVASQEEILTNPRSRSAKLRIATRNEG